MEYSISEASVGPPMMLQCSYEEEIIFNQILVTVTNSNQIPENTTFEPYQRILPLNSFEQMS